LEWLLDRGDIFIIGDETIDGLRYEGCGPSRK